MAKLVTVAVITFVIVIFTVQNLHEVTVNVPIKGPLGIDAILLIGLSFLIGLVTAITYQVVQKYSRNKIRNAVIRRLEESEESLEEVS